MQHRVCARLEQLFHLGIEGKVLRHGCQPAGNVLQEVAPHTDIDRAVVPAGKPLPGTPQGVRPHDGWVTLDRIESVLQTLTEGSLDGRNLIAAQFAAVEQALAVEPRDMWVPLDCPVHTRLGKARFVSFIVAVAAITEHVDHDVLFKSLTIFHSQPGHANHGLGVIAVDVENRRLSCLGHVRWIRPGVGIFRVRRKANLIVDDDVDRATGAIAAQAGEVERFRHHSLTGKGRVPMNQQGDHTHAFAIVGTVLLGAHPALDHWIDRLKVAGVGGEGQMYGFAIPRHLIVREAQVVFDISRAHHKRGINVAFKLGKDHLIRLAQDVSQDVQPAAVRHTDHHLLNTLRRAVFDKRVEQRNQGLGAFQREAFVTDKLGVEEDLEGFRGIQFGQDSAFGVERQRLMVALVFDALLYPPALHRVLDVHVFDPDRATVSLTQSRENTAQGQRRHAEQAADAELPA